MASRTQFIEIEPANDPPVSNVDDSSNWQYVVVTEETVDSDQDLISKEERGCSGKRQVFTSKPGECMTAEMKRLSAGFTRDEDDEVYASGWQITESQSSGEEENNPASTSTESQCEDMKCIDSDTRVIVQDEEHIPKKHQKCEVCCKVIPQRNMKKHLLFHSDERNYPCSLCDKRFFTKSHCRDHEKIHERRTASKGERKNKTGTVGHQDRNNDDSEDTKELDDNGTVAASSSHKPIKDYESVPKNHKNCEVCGKFIPPKHVKQHMLFHSGERNYPCSLCDKRFFTKGHCKVHEKIHNVKTLEAKRHKTISKNRNCDVCGKDIPRSQMKKHMLFHSDERNFPCSLCDKRFYTKSHCRDHEKIHERRAASDGKKCIDNEALKAKGSSNDSKGGKEYKTLEKFSLTGTDSRHRDMNYGGRETVKLLKDGSISAVSNDLPSKHMVVQDDKRIQEKLERHEVHGKHSTSNTKRQMLHTGEKMYIFACRFCGLIFLTIGHCLVHEKTHHAVTDLTCSQCGQECLNVSELRNHVCMKVHERKVVHADTNDVRSEAMKVQATLDEDCGNITSSKCIDNKSAEDTSLLKNGNVPFHRAPIQGCAPKNHKRCEVCGKYLQLGRMKKHMLFHSGERNHPCSRCDKRFFTRAHCRDHETIHDRKTCEDSMVPKYHKKCELCNTFIHQEYMKKHMLIHPQRKKYSCTVCGKRFYTKSRCTDHEKKHKQREVQQGMNGMDNDITMVREPSTNRNGEQDNKHLEKVASVEVGSSHQVMNVMDSEAMVDESVTVRAASVGAGRYHQDTNAVDGEIKVYESDTANAASVGAGNKHQDVNAIDNETMVDEIDTANAASVGASSNHQDINAIDGETKVYESDTVIAGTVGASRNHQDMNAVVGETMVDENTPVNTASSDTIKCAPDISLFTTEHLPLKNRPVEGDEIVPKCYKKCDVCGKFIPPGRMKKHMLFHSGERNYPCSVCGKRFYTNSHRRDHEKIHERRTAKNCKPEDLACPECGRECSSYSGFRKHMMVHGQQIGGQDTSVAKRKLSKHNQKEVVCEKCGKLFKYRRQLVSHMLSHSYMDSNKCDICNKEFRNPYSLKTHIKIHTVEQPEILCHICGKLFRTVGHLDSHMLTHSDIRDLVCNICNKTFKYKLSLKFHNKIHSGHRPYVCSICKMTFFTVTCLKKHERTHRGKTLYKCPQCDIGFSSKYCLGLHIESHSDPGPHDCHLCKSTFLVKRLLARHLERFHDEERC